MHRRSILCLEVPGARVLLRRKFSASASRLATQSAPFDKFRRQPPSDKDFDETLVRSETQLIARNAVRGERSGWKTRHTANGEETRLRGVVPTVQQPTLPSIEKTKFFATPEVEDDDEAVITKSNIPPGTFVEVRRSNVTMHGIIISASNTGRPNTLMARGELWQHSYGDVMFALPNFASADAIARCGTEEKAQNEREVNARIELLRRIKAVEKAVEIESQKIGSALEHALVKAQIYARDPEAWMKITTTEAARLITTKRIIPTITLLCVHKYLMGKPKTFLADQRDYLSTQMFTIRPLREIQEMEAVAQRIHRRDESVLSFVAKAQTLIAASRNKPPSIDGPPTIAPNETCSFTEEDQGYIRFLIQSLCTSRTIQKDAMFVPMCTLVKMINMYDDRVHISLVHKLLVEMNVLPPWDDPIMRDTCIMRNATFVERKEPSTVPSPPPSPLGPDELYPRDIVEHIRHDFGDMPVYVIDDPGAHELDDGVSVEPVPGEPGSDWIHVHIADPTSVIHPGHMYAENARKSWTTLYFVPKNFPLLPLDLVHNGLSLGSDPNGSKVMTFSFKVDSAGEITDYLVRAGTIRNLRIVHYDDINTVLGTTEALPQYPFGRSSPSAPLPDFTTSDLDYFKRLQDVAGRLAKRRRDLGVMQFNTSAVNMKLLSDPLSTEMTTPGPRTFSGFPELEYSVLPANSCEYGSRSIVGECMKGACRVASRFFRDRNISAIRRAAGPLVMKTAKDLEFLLASRDENGCASYADVMRLGARVPAGENTLLTKGHWQLGIPDGEGYVRVTSPLRRYVDMVAHWQIKHALLSTTTGQQPWMFTDIWLNDLAKASQYNEAYVRVTEKRDQKYWALKFIQNQMNSPAAKEYLGSLHAVAVDLAYRDPYKYKSRTRVIVPQLGMYAYLFTPVDIGTQIGQSFSVAVDDFVFSLNPELYLKLRQ